MYLANLIQILTREMVLFPFVVLVKKILKKVCMQKGMKLNGFIVLRVYGTITSRTACVKRNLEYQSKIRMEQKSRIIARESVWILNAVSDMVIGTT